MYRCKQCIWWDEKDPDTSELPQKPCVNLEARKAHGKMFTAPTDACGFNSEFELARRTFNAKVTIQKPEVDEVNNQMMVMLAIELKQKAVEDAQGTDS